MPLYLFKSPKTGKIKEIFFNMNDDKIYVENGIAWERLYTKPQANIKSVNDPFSCQQFLDATRKKESIGDILDRSQELSEERQKNSPTGRDPVKDKFFDDWSKKRGGKKHEEDTRP